MKTFYLSLIFLIISFLFSYINLVSANAIWGYWQTSGDHIAYFDSPTCPSGYPIACVTTSADKEDHNNYGEDDIISITIENSAFCRVSARDTSDENFEHKREVDAVCSNTPTQILWSGWQTNNHDDVAYFTSPNCTDGYYPVSCLSQSDEKDDDNLYGDDIIQSMSIVGSHCVVSADDTKGFFEHLRKVGVVCSKREPQILWSGWQISHDDVAYFTSPDCTPGYYPVSCLSSSAEGFNHANYGEDDLQSINITGSHCVVSADDVMGGSEHNRTVGVVCSNETETHLWGDWQMKNGDDVAYFTSPDCTPGYYPVSCLSSSAEGFNHANYGEDDLQSINITGSHCVVSADDVMGGSEQLREVGVVCSNTQPQILWSGWQLGSSDVAYFDSPDCPPGYHPVSCLTESAEAYNHANYGEDDLQSINITGSHCTVAADDVIPGYEQLRKVGVVCSDIQPQILWDSDWQLGSSDVAYFNSPDCPTGYYPVSCLSQSAEAYNHANYGEDDIQSINIPSSHCTVAADDVSGGSEHMRKVGVVCSPSMFITTTTTTTSTIPQQRRGGGGGGHRMYYILGTTDVLNSPFVIVTTIIVILIIIVAIFSSVKMISKKRKIR